VFSLGCPAARTLRIAEVDLHATSIFRRWCWAISAPDPKSATGGAPPARWTIVRTIASRTARHTWAGESGPVFDEWRAYRVPQSRKRPQHRDTAFYVDEWADRRAAKYEERSPSQWPDRPVAASAGRWADMNLGG